MEGRTRIMRDGDIGLIMAMIAILILGIFLGAIICDNLWWKSMTEMRYTKSVISEAGNSAELIMLNPDELIEQFTKNKSETEKEQ